MKNLALVLTLALAGCIGGTKTSPPVAASPTPTVAAGAAAVAIQGFKFDPAELHIHKGDTVTWTNKDSAAHNVVPSGNTAFTASSDLANGQTFSATFKDAGTFNYSCTIHNMPGKVIVE